MNNYYKNRVYVYLINDYIIYYIINDNNNIHYFILGYLTPSIGPICGFD